MEELNEEKLEEASGGKGLSESLDYALTIVTDTLEKKTTE